MKILFLDMDGVLNSQQSTRMHWQKKGRTTVFTDAKSMCPVSCSNLQYLMEEVPDLNIVISSSWRIMHNLWEMRTILDILCDIHWKRVIGMTPRGERREDGSYPQRGEEIQQWLDEHTKVPEGSPLLPEFQVEDFMIIDDDGDMAHLKETNFLQTDGDLGFTIKDCRKLLNRFKPDRDPVKKLEEW